LGGRNRRPDPARSHLLGRRLGGGIQPPVCRNGPGRYADQAQRRETPQLLSRPFRPLRCGACRRPHLHLLQAQGRRRPDQQLARPRGNVRDPFRPFRRLHARSHHVRHSLLDGAARLRHRPRRRRDQRFALCRDQHARHDPHGQGGLRRPWHRRRIRALRALRRRAARSRPEGRSLALQPDHQVHRPLPRIARNLVLRLRLRRQRPARQEVLRAAHRLDHGAR
jgi:hypothetical protein